MISWDRPHATLVRIIIPLRLMRPFQISLGPCNNTSMNVNSGPGTCYERQSDGNVPENASCFIRTYFGYIISPFIKNGNTLVDRLLGRPDYFAKWLKYTSFPWWAGLFGWKIVQKMLLKTSDIHFGTRSSKIVQFVRQRSCNVDSLNTFSDSQIYKPNYAVTIEIEGGSLGLAVCVGLRLAAERKVMMTSSSRNISALLALCAGNSPITGEFPVWSAPV